jgi:hypothetical protein
MSTIPKRLRMIAVVLAEHASHVMPRMRSPWADAMRRELDYIEDDHAALRWAIGSVSASYAAQLVVVLRFCGRLLSRPLLAAGMLLSVALAFAHANDLAKRPNCEARPNVAAIADSMQMKNPTCSDRGQPSRFIANDGRPQ